MQHIVWHRVTYQALLSLLLQVYAVGDNPAADVRGANLAGPPWVSVLVRCDICTLTVLKHCDSKSLKPKTHQTSHYGLLALYKFICMIL